MHKAPLLLAASVVLAALSSPTAAARADGDGAVVAKVGRRSITAVELIRRMATVPPFQLRTFGNTPEEVKRNFLERVMVREELLAQFAEDQKVGEREEVRERIRAVLRNQLVNAERASAAVEQPISTEDVKAYYNANTAKFHAPPRVSVWRIQVSSEKEAGEILGAMKEDESPKHWGDLARDHSLDKVTSMRSGNLGFVAPDGSTTEEGVRIERSALDAIAKAKDTEIVSRPIKEGDRWDVLWRRQTMRAVDRPLDMESTPIRQVLTHQRTEERLKGLLARLRKDHLTDYHPEEIDAFDIEASGDLALQRRPGALGARRPGQAAPPAPKPGPAGLR